MKKYLFIFLYCLFISCTDKINPQILNIPFDKDAVSPIDYSKNENWAALPVKKDNADKVPSKSNFVDVQSSSEADVFFIHPTTYLKTSKKCHQWNAMVEDLSLNRQTDHTTILYQASVFNGSGKIYSPRYRQAHISSYFTKQKGIAKAALDLAYEDIKNSFQYYLDHYNNGRPIIIASHSQGTTHAIHLLQQFFDSKPLMKQLVAAYLIGMPVYDSLFITLKPCQSSAETGCYVSWRTYASNIGKDDIIDPLPIAICTNPLTWKTDSVYAPYQMNKGGLLKNFNHIYPNLTDARVSNGILLINKPHFCGNIFFHFKNYHIADYNLFYVNIRENAQERVRSFLKNKLN